MTEPRKARLERSTRETKVSVELDVDGTGKFDVDCDIQFLKHMTETFARYAQFDLVLKAGGDNDHHVIEDTAIAMGEASWIRLSFPWFEKLPHRHYKLQEMEPMPLRSTGMYLHVHRHLPR